jgi:hypothetical protein
MLQGPCCGRRSLATIPMPAQCAAVRCVARSGAGCAQRQGLEPAVAVGAVRCQHPGLAGRRLSTLLLLLCTLPMRTPAPGPCPWHGQRHEGSGPGVGCRYPARAPRAGAPLQRSAVQRPLTAAIPGLAPRDNLHRGAACLCWCGWCCCQQRLCCRVCGPPSQDQRGPHALGLPAVVCRIARGVRCRPRRGGLACCSSRMGPCRADLPRPPTSRR